MRPNILLIGTFLSASGGSRAVGEDLAEHLRASGYRVLTTSGQRRRLSRLFDMLGTVVRKRRHYAVAQVDVYSGRAFLYAEVVCAVLRMMGKPYVLTLHGGNLPAFSQRWPWRMRHLLQPAAAVTTPSRYLLNAMQPFRADLRLLPNAVDLTAHLFRVRGHPAPRLLWLRAFHRIYNPALGPRVVARLLPEFPDVHLTMLGPDKGDGALAETEDLATVLGVRERLSLPGAVSKADVPSWLNAADILLNTTDVDNAPVSVLEAMASGLCIVSTRVGGIPYMLEHEKDALLVPPGDHAAMAAAIRRILTEPNLAARLSRNARVKAAEFDWRAIRLQWEALLTTVSRRPNP